MSQNVAVNAALVKQLREKTGAGINDCKKALEENQADLKKAEEWLRAKGVKLEKLQRATAEGTLVVRVAADAKSAVVVELKCETDFSARNAGFQKIATKIAETALEKQTGDIPALLKTAVDGPTTAEQMIQQEMTLGVRENVKFEWMELRKLEGEGRIGTYVHSNNKLAVLVGVQVPSAAIAAKPEFEALVKDLAMHLAGHTPISVAVDRNGVPKDLVESEKRVILQGVEQDPKDAKKPQQVKDKIVEGKLGRFYKERCLLEQQFVKDDTVTVEQLLQNVGKTLGGTPKVLWFTRRTLGGQ